jgi:uncharacterized membrane protein
MNKIEHPAAKGRAVGRAVLRWLVAAAFVFAVVLSGSFSGLMHKAGLFYLAAGCVAVALMGFSLREIDAAFRHAAGRPGTREDLKRAAHFWEAAARNAWILGALGSALNFIGVLGGGSGGIAATGSRMIQSFIVTLYGSVLAVVCLVPAMKLADLAERAPSGGGAAGPAPARPVPVERVMGYVLFATVLAVTVLSFLTGSPQDGPLPLAKVMLHGPAILVVLGGAVALFLFMGAGTGARGLTLGFAVTGLVALLAGLIQAMLGFAHTSIQEIATAVAFIISASSFALLGLGAVAAPLEDREVMEGRRGGPGPLSRMFWVVFPLLTFVFLILTFIMVVTPMTKQGGA